MEKIIEFVKGIDFKNIDFMAILNDLIALVKSLLGDFIGEKK